MNRMIVVPFCAKFALGSAGGGSERDGDVKVIANDNNVGVKLDAAKVAHLNVLVEAYSRYQSDGGFGPLPASSIDFRHGIAVDSDPILALAMDFVQKRIMFNLVRRADQKGRKVLGYVKRDDLRDGLQVVLRDAGRSSKPTEMKKTLDAVMLRLGNITCGNIELTGRQVVCKFTRVLLGGA